MPYFPNVVNGAAFFPDYREGAAFFPARWQGGLGVARENIARDPGARVSPPIWTTRGGGSSNANTVVERVVSAYTESGYAYKLTGIAGATNNFLEASFLPSIVYKQQPLHVSFKGRADMQYGFALRVRSQSAGDKFYGQDTLDPVARAYETIIPVIPEIPTDQVISITVLYNGINAFGENSWFELGDALSEFGTNGPYFDGFSVVQPPRITQWAGAPNYTNSQLLDPA